MTHHTSDSSVAPWLTQNAHWLLRVSLASVFLFHGIDKFLGNGVAGFAQAMDLPVIIALLVAAGEVGAGVFILLGGVVGGLLGSAITRLGAAGMIVILLGAIFMVHWGQWHFMATATHPMGGMQFQVTLALMSAYLMIKGNRA
jgi:putative oxidoreductase